MCVCREAERGAVVPGFVELRRGRARHPAVADGALPQVHRVDILPEAQLLQLVVEPLASARSRHLPAVERLAERVDKELLLSRGGQRVWRALERHRVLWLPPEEVRPAQDEPQPVGEPRLGDVANVSCRVAAHAPRRVIGAVEAPLGVIRLGAPDLQRE
eukprot:3522227-Prymnesium_polylepis.1